MWVAPDGSVQGAWWFNGPNWTRYQLAPAGSASPTGPITSVSRRSEAMEVWWVAPDGSVQGAVVQRADGYATSACACGQCVADRADHVGVA